MKWWISVSFWPDAGWKRDNVPIQALFSNGQFYCHAKKIKDNIAPLKLLDLWHKNYTTSWLHCGIFWQVNELQCSAKKPKFDQCEKLILFPNNIKIKIKLPLQTYLKRHHHKHIKRETGSIKKLNTTTLVIIIKHKNKK